MKYSISASRWNSVDGVADCVSNQRLLLVDQTIANTRRISFFSDYTGHEFNTKVKIAGHESQNRAMG